MLFQTIGPLDNRQAFFDMSNAWSDELKPQHPDVEEGAWQSFRQAMYGGDFPFNVSRDFVASCHTPLLVLMGNDFYQPHETSREVAALAPNAVFVEHWKEPEHQAAARERILAFLAANTPR